MKSGLLEGYLATLYITPLAEVPGFVHGLKRTLWKQISSFEKKNVTPRVPTTRLWVLKKITPIWFSRLDIDEI